jgi:hypothetical protein
MADKQPTFPERRARIEDMAKDLTTIASQLSRVAVTEEAEHMQGVALGPLRVRA